MSTAQELAAMSYNGSAAFAKGITEADFRQHLHGPMGLRPRFWKAYAAPNGAVGPVGQVPERNGRLYIEQTLDSAVRALAYRTERQLYDAEWGTVEAGSTGISVIPSEIELARLDRVAFTDVSWLRREYIQRGSGNSDDLGHAPATSVVRVLRSADGATVPDADYALSGNGKKLVWNPGGSGVIDAGNYYSIEYRWQPRFEYLMDEQAVMQIGSDGAFLPQRGVIRLLIEGEYEV